MKNSLSLTALLVLSLTIPLLASDEKPTVIRPSLVDFPQFAKLSLEANNLRVKRLVRWEKFQEIARSPNTVILDTRSKEAFDQVHLKGAVHLNFSDFTQEKLAKVIPDKNTTILIYCNNNFSTKLDQAARFEAFRDKSPGLALNIPTFINLYGYGYKNIYELSELLDVQDPRVKLEGTRLKAGN